MRGLDVAQHDFAGPFHRGRTKAAEDGQREYRGRVEILAVGTDRNTVGPRQVLVHPDEIGRLEQPAGRIALEDPDDAVRVAGRIDMRPVCADGDPVRLGESPRTGHALLEGLGERQLAGRRIPIEDQQRVGVPGRDVKLAAIGAGDQCAGESSKVNVGSVRFNASTYVSCPETASRWKMVNASSLMLTV